MKQNLLGQIYIDEDEKKLLESAKGKEKIIDALCSDEELMACFNKMSKRSIIESFKNINLIYSIEELENKKESLMKEIKSLQSQLEELKSQEELEESSLKNKIESLKEIAGKLQEKISLQLSQVESNRSSKYRRKHFVFDPVDLKNELYIQNHWTINEFYNKQVYEYSIMTGLEYDEAKKEFDILSGSLCNIVKLLDKHFTNEKCEYVISISSIINFDFWDEDGQDSKRVLNSLLKGVNLPNYQKMYFKQDCNNLVTSSYRSDDDLSLRAENAMLECENDYLREKLASVLINQQRKDKSVDLKRVLTKKND